MRRLAPLMLALALASGSAAASDARAQLEGFAKGLDSLRGSFVQQLHEPDGGAGERSKGTVALQAPRQFRWEYTEPFPQLIVADGQNVWVHDMDLDQVTVRPQSIEEAQSPLTVLTDLSLLDREYTLREAGERDGARWLELVPRAKEPPFAKAELGFVDGALVRLEMVDALGQRNEIRFGRWERNAALDPKLFAFVPPKGVDVVGEPVKAAEALPIRD